MLSTQKPHRHRSVHIRAHSLDRWDRVSATVASQKLADSKQSAKCEYIIHFVLRFVLPASGNAYKLRTFTPGNTTPSESNMRVSSSHSQRLFIRVYDAPKSLSTTNTISILARPQHQRLSSSSTWQDHRKNQSRDRWQLHSIPPPATLQRPQQERILS